MRAKEQPIPEDLRRFILAGVRSIPFLEALLLMRANASHAWSVQGVAERLYIRERAAKELLDQLCDAGTVMRCSKTDALAFRYEPVTPAMAALIDRLADMYSRQLVLVTTLIHSRSERKAQQFANAFTWRKDS